MRTCAKPTRGKVIIIPESRALSLLRERVESYLREGIRGVEIDADGDYRMALESARVFVCPRQWTDDKTVVRVFSITNVGLPPSPDLTRYLVTENFSLLFGHLAYNEAESSVWFLHNLLGDQLDREELLTALRMVATRANHYDDVIKERFGGLLFSETSTD